MAGAKHVVRIDRTKSLAQEPHANLAWNCSTALALVLMPQ